MTLANLEKHHARLTWLASGEFTERDFDYKIEANPNPLGKEKGEGGWSTMGDFINKVGSKRKELIIFKAKNALKIFGEKYPKFKEAEKQVEVKADTKSKG
ncbi:MAG: hypothetical protein KJI72_04230, partial [Patescibacteria group bacterium]|nr:hypothetical protein [Patescibacteria group bacterium]